MRRGYTRRMAAWDAGDAPLPTLRAPGLAPTQDHAGVSVTSAKKKNKKKTSKLCYDAYWIIIKCCVNFKPPYLVRTRVVR